MNKGDNVVYTKPIKGLDFGTVGVLDTIHDTWATIVYPQHKSFEDKPDERGNYIPIKGVPHKLYAHSALIEDIALVTSLDQ